MIDSCKFCREVDAYVCCVQKYRNNDNFCTRILMGLGLKGKNARTIHSGAALLHTCLKLSVSEWTAQQCNVFCLELLYRQLTFLPTNPRPLVKWMETYVRARRI